VTADVAMASSSVDGTTRLELVVPPDPQLLRIVRLVASGLASLANLDLDAVEEVRVAADEVVSTLIEASTGEPVHVRMTVTPELLRLEASTDLGGGTFEPDPMVDRVLEAVASRYAWETVDGSARGWAERDR
jgi:hypothetical protein